MVLREVAVGVDHGDDDLLVVGALRQPREQRTVGGVEGVALAGLGVGKDTSHQVDVGVGLGGTRDDGGGVVVTGVVDDPHVGPRKAGTQPTQRTADHGLLVAARHEDVPRERARIADWVGATHWSKP